MNCRNYIFLIIQSTIFLLGCNALDGEEIIGGDKAPKTSYLYHVSIQRKNRHICGGGLIDEYRVVTAAHCVADSKGNLVNKPLYVVGGTNNLKSSSMIRKGSYVEKVYVPDRYSNMKNNDIAVLKIFESFDFGPSNFLKLPNKFEMHVDHYATVTGFGCCEVKLQENYVFERKLDGALRFSTVKILSPEECSTVKRITNFPQSRMCGQMIQRDLNNPEGVCDGDSGGPLVLNNNVIVGVVNNSSPQCTEESTPATYARVSFYLEFIKKCVADDVDTSIKSIKLKVY